MGAACCTSNDPALVTGNVECTDECDSQLERGCSSDAEYEFPSCGFCVRRDSYGNGYCECKHTSGWKSRSRTDLLLPPSSASGWGTSDCELRNVDEIERGASRGSAHGNGAAKPRMSAVRRAVGLRRIRGAATPKAAHACTVPFPQLSLVKSAA